MASSPSGALQGVAQGYGAQGPWQQRYARPDWQSRLTSLDRNQEALFQMWAKANRVPLTDDYDMRGFWLHRGQAGAGTTAVDPNDGRLHYPDTYKAPLHDTFSGESIYADPTTNPPRWNDRDQLVASDGTILFDDRHRTPAAKAVATYGGQK